MIENLDFSSNDLLKVVLDFLSFFCQVKYNPYKIHDSWLTVNPKLTGLQTKLH